MNVSTQQKVGFGVLAATIFLSPAILTLYFLGESGVLSVHQIAMIGAVPTFMLGFGELLLAFLLKKNSNRAFWGFVVTGLLLAILSLTIIITEFLKGFNPIAFSLIVVSVLLTRVILGKVVVIK
ncbi:MAG: hypothetical protein AB1393_11100 [Candidatus Edwardsbacteria bacterium]